MDADDTLSFFVRFCMDVLRSQQKRASKQRKRYRAHFELGAVLQPERHAEGTTKKVRGCYLTPKTAVYKDCPTHLTGW